MESNVYAQLSQKRHDLQYRIAEFEQALKEDADSKIGSNFREFEQAIKKSLDLQHKATYLVSLCHGTLVIYRSIIRTHRAGTKEYMDAKNSFDEMQTHYDYFKNNVYTFSQRAKVISDLLKAKQLADPETVGWKQ